MQKKECENLIRYDVKDYFLYIFLRKMSQKHRKRERESREYCLLTHTQYAWLVH